VIPEREITGVLTRTPWVTRHELPQIEEADRDYVAAEIYAFLLSWLASLNCPVVNRPMPGRLAGPSWAERQWLAAAGSAGLKVSPRTGELRGRVVVVTVVGRQCFGEASPELHAGSLRLAALAQVELLGVHFDGSDSDALFVGANPFPPLDDIRVQNALFALLQKPVSRPRAFPNLRPWRIVEHSD
jgi:hypothetical protein